MLKNKVLYNQPIDEFGNLKDETMMIGLDAIAEYTDFDNVKNPFNFRSWWNTILAASDASYLIKVKIYETALKYLPGSYKLWFNYLKEARDYISAFPITDKRFQVINDLHERALIFMNKMPRIWLDYCEFLIDQQLVTKTRKMFDNALKSLPVTQHDKIWNLYIDWANSLQVFETTISIYKRYLRFNPDSREEYVNYLVKIRAFEEALKNIIDLLNDDMFYSPLGKTKFDYWLLLSEIISRHPDIVKNIDCESIIRHGLNKYTDEVGRLWISLCNYYIRQEMFEKARDIFEEALAKVSTARDFSLVFNSYLKFEEELVTVTSFQNKEKEMEVEDDFEQSLDKLLEISFQQLGIKTDSNIGNKNLNNAKDIELNIKFFRLTNLIERRPFLLSDALLRQNPNNVKEWLKRVRLCKDDPELTIQTFEKAVTTVDPFKAFGKPDQLWTAYANFLESQENIAKANEVYYRATKVHFRSLDQISNIWSEWAEMHLRLNNLWDAYYILQKACTTPLKSRTIDSNDQDNDLNPSYSNPTSLSLKLWSFYVDLEEHLGTIENVKSIYQRIIDSKIANMQTVLNYSEFLERNLYFEETFRVYEQALNFFKWPQLYDLWLIYLTKFVERYKGERIERARDLFDNLLSSCPKDKIKIFYYMYAELEEEYGLLNHAIRILDKGCTDVPKEDRPEMYSVLISKTAAFFGITKTRNRALETLEPDQVPDIGLKFAAIERKLGEIERSRSILIHISQFCDPSKQENIGNFWNLWEEFELNHGNEDTYKEMLRIKRSVASRYTLNATLFVVENKTPI